MISKVTAQEKDLYITPSLAQLSTSIQALIDQSLSFHSMVEKLKNQVNDLQSRMINDLLMNFERLFLDEQGLKDRKWFKHLIIASGKYSGYGYSVFPGLADAAWKVLDSDEQDVEERQDALEEVRDEIERIISRIQLATQKLEFSVQMMQQWKK